MNEKPSDKPIFNEWQLPRASTFIPHLMIFPSFWLVFAPLNADLGFALGVLASAFSIWIRLAISKKIMVTNNFLIIGKARIPRQILGQATVIEVNEQFSQKGPKLNARAFVAIKALSGLVKIENIDADDPTPYILVSTRRPEQLSKALND